QGRLGPLEVALHDGTFSMAPDVSLALNLIDPTPNDSQGKLRFADLDALDLAIAHVDVFGGTANDSQHDVTLGGNFVVSAFTFPIAEFALDISIDSIKGDPNAVANVSIGARATDDGQASSAATDFVDIIQKTAGVIDTVIDGLDTLAPIIQTTTG